ncbi:MAG: hypothetical protein KIS30_02980 [Thermoplasmata archaeon]|nr:hypothetical protein [Candidatus Sysuiplasma acidicola]MBX8645707.1 hypothetical protein [Candidatus Sysuiplasma acidicola]MDH2906135.1 methyltransferase [Methanomassiliicoccales archaeon]
MFRGADRTDRGLDRRSSAARWNDGRSQQKSSLIASVEKSVLAYLVTVMIPFGYLAAVDYSTPVLSQAFTWTYFDIFPWNFIIFSLLFMIGASWIFWALSYTQHRSGERLIVNGPYSISRNPKGLGYLIILAGLGVLLQSAVAIFIITPSLAVAYLLYLKAIQEPFMKHRYGATYDDYRRNVPMLVPLHLRLRR